MGNHFRSLAGFSNVGRKLCASTLMAFTIALMLGVVGCADMVTYSTDSHREGMSLYNQNQYAEAAGAFRNAVRQNPRSYQDYYMMGVCYDHLGQMQQAIQAYRQSLEVQKITLEGKDDDAQRLKTITALATAIAKADTRDVETNAVVASARTKQNPDEYLLLAKIYAARGDADSAIEAYEHGALLAPENFYISKDFGLYLEKLGQTQRAEAPLRRAYTLEPKDQQVVAALRRIGVVPGPSLKNERDLVGPPVPKGPIPQLNLGRGSSAPQPSPVPGGTVAAPRD